MEYLLIKQFKIKILIVFRTQQADQVHKAKDKVREIRKIKATQRRTTLQMVSFTISLFILAA